MSQLTAVDSREKKDEKKSGPITIAFETVRGESKILNVGDSDMLISEQIKKSLRPR